MDTDGQSFNKVRTVNILLSYEVNKLNGIFPLCYISQQDPENYKGY